MELGNTNKGFEPEVPEVHKRESQIRKKLSWITDKLHITHHHYDPHDHREIEHPIRAYEALIHLLKGSLGTGILAIPAAFKNSGYAVGMAATFIIGLVCLYCTHVLLSANYELSKRGRVPTLTYPELAESAVNGAPNFIKVVTLTNHFPKFIGNMTKIFLVAVQLGTGCVYVVFIASNIKSIVDTHTAEENWIDVRLYMCMILLPLILINWLKNLKYLAPFTAVANLATLISFAIILYYIFREPLSVEGRDAVGSIEKFPLFLGTVLFALEAIGVIIPIQNEMKTPKHFGSPFGVLNIAMFIIITLFMGMGFCGYLKYGNTTEGSITLNLEQDEVLAQCVKAMLAFAIYITHALQSYVAIDILWNDYIKKRLSPTANYNVWEYVVRTASTFITFIFAVAIPNLELFISLVGALCFASLGLILPAVIHTATWWEVTKGFARFRLILLNSFVLIIGLIGFIIGTTISLIEIIEKFSS